MRSFDRTPERRAKARALAERALQLQPELPEAHLALGFSYYYGDNNFDAALREFEFAQRGLPNEAEVYLALGAIQRRQGKWAESTANLEKAVSLNPKDAWALQNLSYNYQMARDFSKANETIDRALAVNPTAFEPLEVKAKFALFEKGDFSVAEKAFEAIKSVPLTSEQKVKAAHARTMCYCWREKHKKDCARLRACLTIKRQLSRSVVEQVFASVLPKSAARCAGARAAFLRAKAAAEAQPEAHARLGGCAHSACKGAGVSGRPLATSKKPGAPNCFPKARMPLAAEITEGVAEVHATLGDSDGAIEILDGLLSRPSAVTAKGSR